MKISHLLEEIITLNDRTQEGEWEGIGKITHLSHSSWKIRKHGNIDACIPMLGNYSSNSIVLYVNVKREEI